MLIRKVLDLPIRHNLSSTVSNALTCDYAAEVAYAAILLDNADVTTFQMFTYRWPAPTSVIA